MPLSFVAMPRGAFTGFQMIFLFRCPFVPEAERMQSVSACPMNEASGHTQPGKPGRMTVAARWYKYHRIGNIHTSLSEVCPFHAPVMSFSFWWILFYGFSPEVFSTQSASVFVYLHFAPFSEPHQSVIFVLGAKVIPGLDGKARSSLLFSVKISSPAGSILTEKPCIP